MRTSTILFLALCWCILASVDTQVQAQSGGAAIKFQTLMTNGNQALFMKNYPKAISYFQQALKLFPTNAQANFMLSQAAQAFQAAQTLYSTNLNAGRVAMGKKDFQTALTDFSIAGNALPMDKTKVAAAQRFSNGVTALQSAFTNLTNGDYTDAKKNYTTAASLLGKDQFAAAPLAEVRLALAESKNPGPAFTQNFNAGVSALVNSKFPQAQTYFKTALGLPVGVNELNKAQSYFDAAVAVQKAYTDINQATPNCADATAQYQTAGTKLTGDANVQVVITRLHSALGTALNAQVAKGNQYLANNDFDNAFVVVNNVTALMTLFPKSANGQAFLTRFQNQAQVTLGQGLANGSINPNNFTVTGSNPSTITINFTSTRNYNWYLKVPAGTMFNGTNIGVPRAPQTMVVLADTSVQVKPASTNSLPVGAVSTIYTNTTPLPQNQLVLGNAAAPKNLLAVLKAVQVAQPGPRIAQFAVWIVLNPNVASNNISIGSVGPTADEIAALRMVFASAGLNPPSYQALQ